MFVCCDCCVLSGRGLCDGLITRPEESYRLWCVAVCDLDKPQEWGGHSPRLGCKSHRKKKPVGDAGQSRILRKQHLTITSALNYISPPTVNKHDSLGEMFCTIQSAWYLHEVRISIHQTQYGCEHPALVMIKTPWVPISSNKSTRRRLASSFIPLW